MTENELKDIMYQKLSLYSSELEDRIEDLEKLNTTITMENERLNNKEERLIRRLEDLIIIGEQVENEWAVDICKMIVEELKGSDKE